MPIFDRVSAELPVTLKISNYALVAADNGTEVQFQSASSITLSLPSVTTVDNGYNLIVRNIGPGTLTLDPTGSDTIDGAASLDLNTSDWRWIRNDGTEWKSVATSAATSGTIAGQEVQCFTLQIKNDSGTLKSVFCSAGALEVSSIWANKINAASFTATTIPTGTDSSTAFAGGGKISSISDFKYICDTNDQLSQQNALYSVTLHYNSTGTEYRIIPGLSSDNINGVTRTRLGFSLFNPTSGNPVSINTTNIPTGKEIRITFFGYLL